MPSRPYGPPTLIWSRRARLGLVAVLVATAALAGASARAQSDQDKEDKGKKELAVKSPWGSFDAQVAADAKGLGLPVYPGAELLKDKDDQALHAELKIEGKPGIKFIVGKFQTRDSRDKVLAFYQKELGKKVTKFTAKDDGGNAVFEIKHKLDQRYVSLKSGEGTTRIDMVRIEGIESDDADVK